MSEDLFVKAMEDWVPYSRRRGREEGAAVAFGLIGMAMAIGRLRFVRVTTTAARPISFDDEDCEKRVREATPE